jgi:anti-sigma factor RsiW
MNCPTDNTLRAYLDAELSPNDLSEVRQHLQNCPACEARLQALSATAQRVGSQLASLDPPPSASQANPQVALARFKASLAESQQPVPFFARIFAPRWRFAWAGSFAAVVLLLSLLFPATRGFAQRLLATLRVERVQTVTVDFAAADNHAPNQPLETLAKLLSDNAVVTTNEKEFTVDSQIAATQAAGFPVRMLLARPDTPTFNISGARAFHLTLDRTRLQDILDQAGRPDLLLPATLDGATVSVQVPRAVALNYGGCKHEDRADNLAQDQLHKPIHGNNATGQTALSGGDDSCLLVIQAPSPVINVPSDLNIQQLVEIGLQLGAWDPVKAREFCQTVDLKSTLVLPIPRNVQSYEAVTINGARGTLMHFSNPRNGDSGFGLIWVDGGIIYSLIGHGDTDSAVQLASSLQ